MKFIIFLITLITLSGLLILCNPPKKDISIHDFMKIDMEITATDQKPESKSAIAKKYGYTLEQYEDFAKKVEKDPKLKEQIGDLILKNQLEKSKNIKKK